MPKGRHVSDKQMQQLRIEFDEVCPQWNYTLRPHIQVLEGLSEPEVIF